MIDQRRIKQAEAIISLYGKYAKPDDDGDSENMAAQQRQSSINFYGGLLSEAAATTAANPLNKMVD